MHQPHPRQMALKRCLQSVGQHGDAVLSPFAMADGELLVGTIDIFDAQTHAFHEAQPGAIEQTGHEMRQAAELGEYGLRLLTGQDGRETTRALARSMSPRSGNGSLRT